MARSDYPLMAKQRADARAAYAILDGTGLSLTDAAKRAVAGTISQDRLTVSQVARRFLDDRANAGLRERTVEWYDHLCGKICAKIGERKIDAVTRAEMLELVAGYSKSAGTRASVARALRAIWNWAAAQEPPLVGKNVATSLPTTSPSSQGDAAFLTVDECASIMRNAGKYRSGLALLLFAGVRPEELAGRSKGTLTWRSINVAEKQIRIPGDLSKTGKPRINEELPEAVWRWLKPLAAKKPIIETRTQQLIRHAQRSIGREWPFDATRHTFGTYALALTNDAGKVSHWLGHEGSTGVIHRHYRGLATKAQAEQFFALSEELMLEWHRLVSVLRARVRAKSLLAP